MDVLSEVLRIVKLEGALFFNGNFSAPWCLSASQPTAMAPYFSPVAGHLIIYHFLTEGRAYASLPEGRREELTAGDIVIFPHGDPHLLGNGSPAKPPGLLENVGEKSDSGAQTCPLRWRRSHAIRVWIHGLRAADERGLSGWAAEDDKSARRK